MCTREGMSINQLARAKKKPLCCCPEDAPPRDVASGLRRGLPHPQPQATDTEKYLCPTRMQDPLSSRLPFFFSQLLPLRRSPSARLNRIPLARTPGSSFEPRTGQSGQCAGTRKPARPLPSPLAYRSRIPVHPFRRRRRFCRSTVSFLAWSPDCRTYSS